MSATTRCPTCNTRFKVSDAQLDAFNGLVRCGRCQAVFDAREHLQDDQPSPQLDLPILSGETREEAASVAGAEPDEITRPLDDIIAPAEVFALPAAAKTAIPAGRIALDHGPENLPDRPPGIKSRWPLVAANLMLLFILLAQGVYSFRIPLAANLPGIKPALVAYCRFLQCTIPLPRKLDLMSIESSDLVADPAQPSIISLDAILRNQAHYAQAYPNLELTLTDNLNVPVARRTFSPAEYLNHGYDEKQGLMPNRELNIKLNFDTADLKPSGYKLFIY